MVSIRTFIYRARCWILGWTFNPWVALVACLCCLAVSILLRHLSKHRAFSLLCLSHRILLRTRLFDDQALNRCIERALKRAVAPGGLVESITSGPARISVNDVTASRKHGIVLKAPQVECGRVVERGVLLLKYTGFLDSFRRCAKMLPILERYTLVLEPSWSGYADPKLLSFCAYRDRIVVESPYPGDYRFLDELKSNLAPVAAGASDWVDPRVFRPLDGTEKQFDAVMIARWTMVKRHDLLFLALRRIADKSFRVALIANKISADKDRDVILSMIREFRLGNQISVFESLAPAEVNVVLNQSSVNLLLSRQEGSNRSLFEGFFAGVPGLAFANHVGIPVTHFTAQTGRLIAEHELADALLFFRSHRPEFDPRTWALANIAPELTTSRLNLVLRRLAGERRERWTRDIVCKCNCPSVQYYPDASVGDGFARIQDLLSPTQSNPDEAPLRPPHLLDRHSIPR
jgi:glycosyltransferase involved in cell wall biosynthesis